MFYSCGDNEEEQGKKGKLLKTALYICDGGATEILYTAYYDNQNRLTKFKMSGVEFEDETSYNFQYSTNAITLTTIDTSGNKNIVLQLNDSGYLINDEHCYFTYENGYVKEVKYAEYDRISKFSWINGNMVQETGSNHIITYEYSNRENLLNIDLIRFFNTALPPHTCMLKFKGLASKNHLVKMTENSHINSYEYEFDKDGYPIQIIGYFYRGDDKIEEFKYVLTYY